MSAQGSGARIDGLFDQARAAVAIEDLVRGEGFKVIRAGKELRSGCPMCGAGSKSHTAFAIKGEKWRCYGSCDRGGDVVDLEQELRGGTAVEAARRLVGQDVPAGPARRREVPKAPEGPSAADRVAAELWATSRPFAGTLGERYLARRGIAPAVIALAADQLRFHPHAKHSWDPSAGAWTRAPAMLAQVVTASGPTGGVHATYLARDGLGKAALDPAKRMWGPQLDAQGRPGGAWLIGPNGDGDLVVSEGIESGLSVATLALRQRTRVRVAAALSLNRLQGGALRDADGCMDVFAPAPDPERPAFTWPTPTDRPWRAVLVAVDRDMSPVRVPARTGRGKPCSFLLDGEARARLSARLAVLAWIAAGAPRARSIQPSAPGLDFNDDLRRVLALESNL